MSKEQKDSQVSPFTKVIDFLSSFTLGLICLVMLGLLVWLSTLEMETKGLYATIDKYYGFSSPLVIPELSGKKIPLPLLGGYWTCAILFVNMTLGGILKIRKGPKYIGIIMSHLGIIALLVVGAVDHHYSIHSRMSLYEGGSYDFTEKYDTPSVEVFAYSEDGEKQKPYVIKEKYLRDLEGSKARTFIFKDLPFDVEITHFLPKCYLVEASSPREQGDSRVINGRYLKRQPGSKQFPGHGCIATIIPKNGEPTYELIIAREIAHPQTFAVDGVLYGIEMPDEVWKMPFEIQLLNSIGELYPGTQIPKHYQSDFLWSVDGELQKEATISMNKPLRYEGFTVYQANYNPPIAGMKNSGFAIVTNPADQWPLYCLLVAGSGLIVHFGIMLVTFLSREFKKNK